MIFYHASTKLKEGEIVNRGTKKFAPFCDMAEKADVFSYEAYQKTLSLFKLHDVRNRTGRDEFKWACEAIFESVRREINPDAPSRIWGFYMVDSLDAAKQFKEYSGRRNASIYEISLPDAIKVQRHDMEIFSMADGALRQKQSEFYYEQAIDLARVYWRGVCLTSKIEFLCDYVNIVIGKKVE